MNRRFVPLLFFTLVAVQVLSQTDDLFKEGSYYGKKLASAQYSITGEVLSKTSFQNPTSNNVYTKNILLVKEVFVGNLQVDSTITVLTEGGEFEDSIIVVGHGSSLSIGVDMICFLSEFSLKDFKDEKFIMLHGENSIINIKSNPHIYKDLVDQFN